MKVLHIHDKAPAAGGVARHVELATNALRQAGVEVATLRLVNGAAGDEDVFPSTYWPHQGALNAASFVKRVLRIAPDLLHLHAGFTALAGPLLAALKRKWPVVGTLHDVAPFCMRGDRRYRGADEGCERVAGIVCRTSGCWRATGPGAPVVELAHLMTKARLRNEWLGLDRVIVPSLYMAELTRHHGVDADRLATIPNFTPVMNAEAIPWEHEPLILFVGALTRAKGADVVVEALLRLPGRPWCAAFAGEGPERAAMEARIAASGLSQRFTFHGACDRDALARLRARSTLSLFTSRIFESFGLVGIESLAAGRPVVGVARGGAADWLLDGSTGLAVAQLDAEALASRIGELLWDPERASALGEQGRRAVQNEFSERAYVRRTMDLYDGVLARSPRAALQSCAAG